MNIEEKIESIKWNVMELMSLDVMKKIFGSSSHMYVLNPVKTEVEIIEFEKQHQITLPEGFRSFLLLAGNGGAGPYYGLESLENSTYANLNYKSKNDLVDPSKPFPHSESWNLSYKDHDPENNEGKYYDFDDLYFDRKWVNGLLRICNFGCGVSINLIVNGPEYGNIWVDDRSSDGGIYPQSSSRVESRTDFLSWDESWGKTSVFQMKNNLL